MYNDADEVIDAFWREFPHLDREKITDYSGNGKMFKTDTRCAFVDFVDSLQKDGQLAEGLADTVTLD